LSLEWESGSAEKQDSCDKSEIYTAGWEGTASWQKQVIIPNLKILWRKYRGEINTYRLYLCFWRTS
jgi:hypothetical protein